MQKKVSRSNLIKIGIYALSIILLITSMFLPFVDVDGKNLFLVHIFNPTSHEYNGEIESIYGFLLPILTLISLVIDFINFKAHEYKKDLYNTVFKITLLASYIFTLMNYVRVIYPDGFILTNDISILYTGFYLFIVFLITLLAIIVLKCNKLYHIRKDNIKNMVINYDKTRKKYYIVVEVFSYISMFCVFSLLFVPFARNYQNYMIEPGFTEILDKRTSIDYYIFSMFDSDFNLNILGILYLYLASFIPATLLLIPKKTTYIQVLISAVFQIILGVVSISIATSTYQLITPKLYLDIDFISIIFLSINLVSLILIIVFTSLLINYRQKEIKDVAKNISEL